MACRSQRQDRVYPIKLRRDRVRIKRRDGEEKEEKKRAKPQTVFVSHPRRALVYNPRVDPAFVPA
jgi:hypothetical protein